MPAPQVTNSFGQPPNPSTTLNDTLTAFDPFYNESQGTSFNVQTAPAGAIDPRRIGVKSTGEYWGALGESIDARTGNLNFSLPLLTAQSRGSSLPLSLSYNSQIWSQDPAGIWQLGTDVGYGYGWTLQAGSVVAFWNGCCTVDHYLFTDSTGAQYTLGINTNGVWTSNDGIYLSYDPNSQRLNFPNGSFWIMGDISAGTEQDAGTMYPTVIEDSNGNQTLIRYNAGAGVPWTNSSARISEIEDVRAVYNSSTGTYRTYSFTYNSDAIPHLTGITNWIGTSESYTLAYTGTSLVAPFSPPTGFGSASLLQSVVTNNLNLATQFQYDSSGSVELDQVTFPFGGHLRWAYRTFTYSGSRSLREVQNRYLAASAGATEANYSIAHNDGVDAGYSVHTLTTIDDPSGNGERAWFFAADNSTSPPVGFVTAKEERAAHNGTVLRHRDFTWTQDSAGNPYVASITTTLDPGTSYQQQNKTAQTVDTHGNVTQTQVYDLGNLNTPARTYTNNFLNNSNYTSLNIWNRLASQTVSNGSQQVNLVTNTYDGTGLASVSGLREHDDANYPASFTYRGNLTQSQSPGQIQNAAYDMTGFTTESDDGNGHSVVIGAASGRNNAAAGSVTPNGNSQFTTTYGYNAFLAQTSASGPNGATSGATYDSYGRLATTTSPHGAVTTYTYNYNPPTVTATVNGRFTRTLYDGLGRPISVTRGDSSSTKSEVDITYLPPPSRLWDCGSPSRALTFRGISHISPVTPTMAAAASYP